MIPEINRYLACIFGEDKVPKEVIARCEEVARLVEMTADSWDEPTLRSRQIVAMIVAQWKREQLQLYNEDQELLKTIPKKEK